MLKSPQLFENRIRSQPHKIRRHSIICTCVLEDGKTFQKCNVSSITIVCKQIKNFGYMQEATRPSWSGDQKMASTTVVCSLYFSIVVEIVGSIQKVGQQMLQVRFFIVSRWMQTVDLDYKKSIVLVLPGYHFHHMQVPSCHRTVSTHKPEPTNAVLL